MFARTRDLLCFYLLIGIIVGVLVTILMNVVCEKLANKFGNKIKAESKIGMEFDRRTKPCEGVVNELVC